MRMTSAVLKDTRRSVTVLIITAVLGLLFVAIKFGGVWAIRELYHHDRMDLLQSLIPGADPSHDVLYYVGWAQEKLLGPLSQVVIFGAFVMIVLQFFETAGGWTFGLIVFGFLLMSKGEAVMFPPYGDAIGGPLAEAWWLATHHFDYAGLIQQVDYAQGGPRVYVFSVYPTYAALWFRLLKDPQWYFPGMHLVVFGLFAAVTGLLREVARKVMPDRCASLTAVLFLALPLIQSQSEALNMEPPCLFFIMVSAFFAGRRRVWAAALAAVGALLIKGTGIAACAAVGIIVTALWIQERKSHRAWDLQLLLLPVGLAALSCLKLASKYFLGDAHVSAGMVGLFHGWPSFKIIMSVRWFLAGVIGILLALAGKVRDAQRGLFETGVMLVYGVMIFLLLLNFTAVSPRYTLSAYPFIVFAVVRAAAFLVRSSRVQTVLLVLAILTSSALSYGYTHGPRLYDHVMLERSLEYRTDLFLDREVARTVEEGFSSFKIGAPMQMAQILGIRELGYTTQDLDVFIYGFDCHYGGIESYPGLQNLNITRTVFVGKQSDDDAHEAVVPDYPIDPQDLRLRKIEYGENHAWIFMGGHAIEKLYRAFYRMMYEYQQRIRAEQESGGQHAAFHP